MGRSSHGNVTGEDRVSIGNWLANDWMFTAGVTDPGYSEKRLL